MSFDPKFSVVGKFHVKTPALRVSDPCYDPEVWCSGAIPAKTGEWEAAVYIMSDRETDGWGERVSILAVRHKDTKLPFDAETILSSRLGNRPREWVTAPFEVGVDSGQAGFFENEVYVSHRGGMDSDFYEQVCDITLRKDVGVIDYGAVSSSGYGDGGYECIYHQDENGMADFAFLVFICEDEQEGYETV